MEKQYDFKLTKKRGGFKKIRLGLFIRDYLMQKGEAYPYEIFRAYREEQKKHGWKKSSYHSFWRYFYILRELGLIRRSGKTKKGKYENTLEQVYYRAVKRRINSPLWKTPQKKLWESAGLGKKYRRIS